MQTPRTASDESDPREKEETARTALRTWMGDKNAEWTRALRGHERLLTRSWGQTAQRFEKRMDDIGVVLVDQTGQDATKSFVQFLNYFSLGDELVANQPTGRKEHVAAAGMLESFGMILSRYDSALFTIAHVIFDDRLLLLSIRQEKIDRDGVPLFP
jgi:hypothetical protein